MKTIYCIAFLAFATVACMAPRPPAPKVAFLWDASVDAVSADRIEQGVATWQKLGFELATAEEQKTLVECPLDWSVQGVTDCKFTVWVGFDDLGPRYRGLSDIGNHTIYLNRTLVGQNYNLWLVASHELGHVLINTHHLETYNPAWHGMMSTYIESSVLTADDYANACRSLGEVYCGITPED